MYKLKKIDMNKDLIEKINMLGPWVHGFFDLSQKILT